MNQNAVAAPEEVEFTIEAPPDVAPGVYMAQLTGLRVVEFTSPEGEERELVAWEFDVLLPDGETFSCDGVTSRSTGPMSKAFRWLAALMGATKVTPGARFRTADLVGKSCQVNIGPDKKGWPKVLEVVAIPLSMMTPGQQRAAIAAAKPVGDEAPLPEPPVDLKLA